MEYEVVIIGGGPAGLTAGLYTARGGRKTALIEMGMPGGQAANTEIIENYPGFPEGISGAELMQKFAEQAQRFNVDLITGWVKAVDLKSNPKKIITDTGEYRAQSVIIASGARPKKLGVPGEEKFQGAGVSYCALCDGAFFKDKKIIVVGGGDSALEEGNFLTKYAREVIIVHWRDTFRAAQIYQDRVKANPKISIRYNTAVEEIMGEGKVEKVRLKNLKTGEREEMAVDGVFIFIGTQPNTEFLAHELKLDERGYIITNEELGCSQPGVFAAGDVRQKTLRQVSTAVGDGAIAAMGVEKYLAAQS